MQRWDWDHDDEQEKERRLQERRKRVQERLAAQKQQGAGGSGEGSGEGAGAQHPSKGRHEAQLSEDAVRQLREQCDAEVAALRDRAEQREDARREQWGQAADALRAQVAAEAETCKEHNRAIDLEWESVHNSATPQAAAEAMAAVRQHCEQVLQSKDGIIISIQAVLHERDEAYTRLLHGQTEETDTLIALLSEEYERFKRGQEQALEAVEAAYMQERSELISCHKTELGALLERRAALEQGAMDQYLKACEAYQAQLEAMRVAEAQEYSALKRRLEAEVASLESHLDGMRSMYMLNADKLEYNVRVLSERERENKEALQQQKRKVTRQWEVLSKLKKRYAAMDKRCVEENLRLADEYQQIMRAFNHLQTKYRHFKAADLARFAKIRDMKEEELEALLERLAEADAAIRQHVLGLGLAGSRDALGVGSAGAGLGAAGEGEEEGCQEGLAVVGRALTGGSEASGAVRRSFEGAAAGAMAAAEHHLGDEESEVLVLSSEEVAQRGQLIAAYRPDAASAGEQGEAGEAAGQGRLRATTTAASGAVEPLAWQELEESLEGGVLSLLLAAGPGSSREGVDGSKVLRLLQQLPEVEPGQWDVACVARGLGLHHEATRRALEQQFQGGGGKGEGKEQAGAVAEDVEADSVQPLRAQAAGEGASGGGGSSSQVEGAAGGMQGMLVGAQQVQEGLQRLVAMLQGVSAAELGSGASTSVSSSSGSAASSPAPAAMAGVASRSQPGQRGSSKDPTSAAYWSRRVDAVLPPEVFQSWALLEPQLEWQFKLLRSRSKAAEEVALLKRENETLKGRLKELMTSPANRDMQLPIRILLE